MTPLNLIDLLRGLCACKFSLSLFLFFFFIVYAHGELVGGLVLFTFLTKLVFTCDLNSQIAQPLFECH